jgi:Pvc16 N-terminal domain
VSVVLVDLLNNGLIDHDVGAVVGGNVVVSALPPDRVLPSNGGSEKTQLNLFLYQVTPNVGWRNIGLPSQNARGERISNPPLALDLHYLLSAYGEKDFHSEILLGYAMQLLHERPVLARPDIRRALAAPSPLSTTTALPPSLQELATSGLADQVELIKITPEPLSTEEMSKLWTAFQSHYRSTAAYEATVVLIESTMSTRSALPVLGDRIFVHPLRRPVIESVEEKAGPNTPILADSTIEIRGEQLAGDITLVRISGVDFTPPDADVSAETIEVDLSSVTVRAGVQTVQVVHQEQLGDPLRPHRGVESNSAYFVVRPAIVLPILKALTQPAPGLNEGTISFDVAPDVRIGQHAVLLLNELLPIASPPDAIAAAYSFPAPAFAHDTNTVTFDVADLPDGTYLVRIQIDGVESPLETAPSGRYDQPQVTIP